MVSENKALAAPELPVDRVERLASELGHALDAWQKDTKTSFIAHVHPASSGKGMWFQNSMVAAIVADKSAEDAAVLRGLLDAHEKACEVFINVVDRSGHDAAEVEFEAKEAAEQAIMQHPCKTIDDVREKALLALADDAFFDSLKNCFAGKEWVLTVFLRSLLGEVAR